MKGASRWEEGRPPSLRARGVPPPPQRSSTLLEVTLDAASAQALVLAPAHRQSCHANPSPPKDWLLT